MYKNHNVKVFVTLFVKNTIVQYVNFQGVNIKYIELYRIIREYIYQVHKNMYKENLTEIHTKFQMVEYL